MPEYLIEEHGAKDAIGALSGVAEVHEVSNKSATSNTRFIESPHHF